MISFAYPKLLYLLLLVPAVALLFAWTQHARTKKLKRFGRLDVIAHLMPDVSKYTGWLKMSLELIALALIIIATARPYTTAISGSGDEETTARGIEVMICLDVSNSMLASSNDDPGGISRLQRAKFVMEKLIDRMNDDKVGLIVFAGDAYTQLPITSDYISAKMFLNDINTDMVPTQGTAIGAALDMAINSFTPESDFEKAIILITDGENFEDNAVEVAKRAADAGIQVDVVGVGGGKGAPIPIKSAKGKYLEDQNGERVITALNEPMAREISEAGNGIYVSANSSSAVSDIDDKLNEMSKAEYKRLSASPSAELFPIAILIALVLILIDTILPYRKISWLKGINFFTKN